MSAWREWAIIAASMALVVLVLWVLVEVTLPRAARWEVQHSVTCR